MPKVRIVLKESGSDSTFHEDYIIEKEESVEVLVNEILSGDRTPAWELVEVQPLDIWIHNHTWIIYRSHKQTAYQDWLRCQTCGILAKRTPGKAITRDPDFSAAKYEYCREEKPKPSKPLVLG